MAVTAADGYGGSRYLTNNTVSGSQSKPALGRQVCIPATATKNGDKMINQFPCEVNSSGEMALHGFQENIQFIARIMVIIAIISIKCIIVYICICIYIIYNSNNYCLD